MLGVLLKKDVSMTTVELRVATKGAVIYRTFEQETKKLLNTAIVFPKYEIKLTNKDIPSIDALAIKMVSGRVGVVYYANDEDIDDAYVELSTCTKTKLDKIQLIYVNKAGVYT